MLPNPTPAPRATLPLGLIPEDGWVLGWGLQALLLDPRSPLPCAGPQLQTWQGSKSEVSPLPPKCCAGGSRNKNQMWAWQREWGGRRSRQRQATRVQCWGFILSIVTSPPNLWHFNYSPTRLLSLGQRVSSPFPLAWKGGGRCLDPHPAPGKLDGGQAGGTSRPAAPSCSRSP